MSRFNPYSDNGGTVVAVAGDDYAIIASDTRLMAGFSIYTRNQSKLFPLSETAVLGSTGCWPDVLSLTKLLYTRMKMFGYEYNKTMATQSIAQMLSIALYNRRFFPYYTYNILAGLDENGKGAVFSYDPVGHFDRCTYRAAGSSGALIQPLLDNILGKKNQELPVSKTFTAEEAMNIVRDAFVSSAERDILVGDGITVAVVTKDGIKEQQFDLRQD